MTRSLGTALGDWTADTAGIGYLGSAAIFTTLLVLVAFGYYRTKISHTVLFWVAFVLTRPLGAVVGDFLDKPVAFFILAWSFVLEIQIERPIRVGLERRPTTDREAMFAARSISFIFIHPRPRREKGQVFVSILTKFLN